MIATAPLLPERTALLLIVRRLRRHEVPAEIVRRPPAPRRPQAALGAIRRPGRTHRGARTAPRRRRSGRRRGAVITAAP